MPAAESASSPANARLGIIVGGGAIALAGLAAYHNSFSAPFFFDDREQVTGNETIRHLSRLGTVLFPHVKGAVGGRPLLNFSFAINYAFGGLNVRGYHALNLLIHLLAGLTLFGVVRRTLERWRPRQGSLPLAFAVALIWTVHPLQTEAVTYVSERAESLMGLFYLLTLYCFIRYADETGGKPKAISDKQKPQADANGPGDKGHSSLQPTAYRLPPFLWGLLSIGACLLAVATKEIAVTAPLVVLLYDRTFVSGDFRAALRRHGRLYLGLAATWLLLAYLMIDLRDRGAGFGMGASWWVYALGESRVIIRYLCLALWPHPLVFDYGMGVRHPGWEVLPYVVAVIILVAASVWALFRPAGRAAGARALGFAGAWTFLIIAPTTSIVAVAGQPMAEHRMYLSLAAVIASVFVPLHAALRRDKFFPWLPQSGSGKKIWWLFVFAVAAICICLTVRRNEVYRSEEAIWSDTVARQPDNERAQNGLGIVLAGEGELPAAIGHYREAIHLKPDYAEAHQNLAAALTTLGRIPEAVAECEEVLRLRPNVPESHYNLGVVLQLEGRNSAAIAEFTRALQLRPDYADAEDNLGLALADAGRYPDAVAHFERGVQLQPENAEAHLNLGSALYSNGDIAEAVRQMKEAVRLRPGFAEGHYNLGVALRRLGREQEATAEFDEARRLQK
jgi:protein O-mannosyl-transferase